MTLNYIKVADGAELRPGKMICVRAAGRKILLANIDGRYYATDDTCTHEDASLSKGFLKGDVVKCPLHGSRFNLCTGVAMDEPAEENLKTYPVRLDGNGIYIGVE